MFYVYILKSLKTGQYYIGQTNNIIARLGRHNSNSVSSTKNKGPWEIFHKENFRDRVSAIKREKQIKSWKSRKAIERLKFLEKIEDPRFQ
jgi:putative endonuclease